MWKSLTVIVFVALIAFVAGVMTVTDDAQAARGGEGKEAKAEKELAHLEDLLSQLGIEVDQGAGTVTVDTLIVTHKIVGPETLSVGTLNADVVIGKKNIQTNSILPWLESPPAPVPLKTPEIFK